LPRHSRSGDGGSSVNRIEEKIKNAKIAKIRAIQERGRRACQHFACRSPPALFITDEEFLFRICVNRRVLRASQDSVAAGRAGVFVAK
jgi:hypothetical protein